MIKQKIISLLCVVTLCISASACAKNEKNTTASDFHPILSHTTENVSGEFETVAENGELCLLYKPDTTDVRCMVKTADTCGEQTENSKMTGLFMRLFQFRLPIQMECPEKKALIPIRWHAVSIKPQLPKTV